MTMLAFLTELAWIISFLDPDFERWRILLAFFLILLAHVWLLIALLLVKFTVAPLLRSVLGLHFGWALTWAATTLMVVVSVYDVTSTARHAWEVSLLLILTAVSGTLALELRNPMIAIGTAWGVFSYVLTFI